jgi:hypothetical protein
MVLLSAISQSVSLSLPNARRESKSSGMNVIVASPYDKGKRPRRKKTADFPETAGIGRLARHKGEVAKKSHEVP